VARFIGERIEVEGGALELRAFVWRGERHEVRRMLVSERDVDLASPWWRRHHRAVLVVETADGRQFKLRRGGPVGSREGDWTLYEELEGGERQGGPGAGS
jgi:hypothetical protein